jgi:hypothetical protein
MNRPLLSTTIPFITGDQPVVCMTKGHVSATEMEFYWPVTPQIALYLSKKKKRLYSNLDIDQVIELNKDVFRAAKEQIYANEKVILEGFL